MISIHTGAKIVGCASAAWLSGNIAALSLISVPAAKRAKTENGLSVEDTVAIWKHTYEAGKAQNPPSALASAASFAFLAWAASGHLSGILTAKAGRTFLTAAFCTVGIVPYTISAMRPTNNQLLHYATKSKKGELASSERHSVDALLDRWVILNGIRSLLPLIGVVIAGFV